MINKQLTAAKEKLLDFFTSRQYRTAILFTAIFSMLANGFAYLNLYPQHDSVNHMFEFAGTWELSLGRFLLPYFGQLQGQITMPWLVGLGSIFLISLMVWIICDLMDLQEGWQIAAVSGILSANLCITELAAVFTFTLTVYMLAALLGCLGAWVLLKRKSFWRYPAAMILFTLSMGLYQAEILVSVTLLAVAAVKALLAGDKPGKVILRYIGVAVTLVCAAALYYLLYQLFLDLHNLEPADSYNSLSNLQNVTPEALLVSVQDSYRAFFRFFYGEGCFVGRVLTRSCNIFLTALALILLVIHFIRHAGRWFSHVLTLLILAVLPGIICLLDIFMSNATLSFYLMLSLYLYDVLILAVIVHCGKGLFRGWDKLVSLAVAICFFLITAQNVVFSNQIYSYQKIMYDRATSVATRILDKMETTEGYVIGETEVIMLGSLRNNKDLSKTLRVDESLPKTLQGNMGLRELMNESDIHGARLLSITYNQTFDSFAYLLGSEINTLEDTEIVRQYLAMEEVQNMPVYPAAGCCQMIDGRMVVKLS